MRSYHQYCPIAMAAEVLGDRWTLLIVRELLAGSVRFNELQRGLPGISRSVLAQRLRLLQREGVVVRVEETPGCRYEMTPAGRELEGVLATFSHWGARWALREPRPEQLDPARLVWAMHRRLRPDRVPEGRTVVEFRFYGCRRERVWLVIEGRKASVCLKPPGPEPDLVITAAIESLYLVWLRQLPLDGEIRAGRIRTEGPWPLARAWPDWFAWRDLPPAMTADWQGRAEKRELAVTEEATP
ncbi:MAG TPA: helix-turn-helix domain-containing protein [Thermoanaerobaculia bacterium]|jgi:DNA-binding HxlR family transcriptional regulator|nr:helix-turn-helix domain-containing protein [Thermoanaerobaculia bacterium]